MNILSVNDLQLAYGVQTIFDGINFGIAEGERIALVGHNGAGKTTLLNLIAGLIKPDDGELVLSNNTSVGYLPQRVEHLEEDTTLDLLNRAVAELRSAIEQHRDVSQLLANHSLDDETYRKLVAKQAQLQHMIERLGGWNYEHEIDEMVYRLSLRDLLHKPLRELSGGQKRRCDLARTLLSSHSLLLLDEPTNHLDTATVEWLESWLLSRTKTLLFVTHDRYFLERIATRILEISGTGAVYDHPGNYGVYMERKIERLQVAQKTEDRRQNLLRRELAWLRQGIKARGTRSKRRLADLNSLRSQDPLYKPELQLDINIADGKSLGSTILEGIGLTKKLGDQLILDNTSFVLARKDRVGVVGPNGCGKTTLIRLLMEELPLDAGTINHGARTDVAWLRQSLPELDPSKSVYDAFSDSDYVWIGDQKMHKQQYLRNFLFDPPLQRASTTTLSGGQRRRFELAKIIAQNANVIILDEPTNDLDLTSLQALEDALDNYSGCIIAISHDRYFLNKICNRIVAFENCKLEWYEGNYDDYKEKIEQIQADSDAEKEVSKSTDSVDTESVKSPGPKLTYAQRLRIPKLEAEIEAHEAKIAELENALADPELYTKPPEKMRALNDQLNEVKDLLDHAFEEWSQLESIRETEQ